MKAIHPNKLRVGDVVTQWVHFDHSPQEMKLTGEVIWIHPDKEFYRVKFKQPKGYCIESYRFYGKQSGDSYVPIESHRQPKFSIVEGELK